MRQEIPSDKYSVAWFKLAECVARGEKERALGVYRLLSHSIEDQAFASQLAGDLLWAFDDEDAASEYYRAAELYQKDNRLLEAAAVYEHLVTLMPKKELYLKKGADLYLQLECNQQAIRCLTTLFELFLEENKRGKAHDISKQLDKLLDHAQAAGIHKEILFSLIKDEDAPQEKVVHHLHKAIDCFLSSNNDKKLQTFLSQLKAQDQWCYDKARLYLKK